MNPKNAHSVDETFFEKLIKRKWWLFGLVLVLIFGGAVVGLFIYSTKTKASTIPEYSDPIRPYTVLPSTVLPSTVLTRTVLPSTVLPSTVLPTLRVPIPHVFTPGKCNNSDQCDNGRNMCNFDGEMHGFCENCANYRSPEDCQGTGFITARGFDNCIKHCGTDDSVF